MRTGKTTDVDLPKEIEALIPAKERTPLIKNIIAWAKDGQFHCFKSEIGLPKLTLYHNLIDTKDKRLIPIATDVSRGIYDEEPPFRKK